MRKQCCNIYNITFISFSLTLSKVLVLNLNHPRIINNNISNKLMNNLNQYTQRRKQCGNIYNIIFISFNLTLPKVLVLKLKHLRTINNYTINKLMNKLNQHTQRRKQCGNIYNLIFISFNVKLPTVHVLKLKHPRKINNSSNTTHIQYSQQHWLMLDKLKNIVRKST